MAAATKTLKILLLLLSLASVSSTCRNNSPGGPDPVTLARQRGTEIIAEFRRRDEAPYRKARVRLTVTPAVEAEKSYELEIWRKQTSEGTLTLTHVVKPATERDLASLSIQRPDQPTVNVAYAQSTDRFYESDTSKQTFGGLTAHELLGEWDKYDFRLVAERQTDKATLYEVECTLKQNTKSPIPRLTALFRSDSYLPAELHLFNSQGDEIRTVRVQEYRTVEGRETVWRTEIANHARNSKLTVEVLALAFPDKIKDGIFTRENLKRLVTR